MDLRAKLRDRDVTRRIRLAALLALLGVAIWIPLYFVPFRVFQFTLVLVYAIAVLGLGLLTGYNGQISLGHGAFFAVGAYTAAILMAKAGWAYPLTLPPAALLTFLLGFGVGIPALRLHRLYLALVTLALAVVTPPILKRFSGLTGGAMGLTVPKPSPPEWTGLASDQWLYFLALVAAIAAFVLAYNIVHSRIGRAMIAIRENPIAAETMGVELARVKTLTFAWSAMFAGVAGVLFTWVIGFTSPDSFTVVLSVEILAALVVGGLASIWGPLFGAAFLVFVPNIAQDVNQAAPGIAFGALLIIVLYVAPGGLAGLGRRMWTRIVGAGAVTEGAATPATSGGGRRPAGAGQGPTHGALTDPRAGVTPRSHHATGDDRE